MLRPTAAIQSLGGPDQANMAICRSSPRWVALVSHLIHEKDGNDVFETVGAGGLKLFKQCWMLGGTISQSTYGTHR